MIDVDTESEQDEALLGHMMVVAAQLAQSMNIPNGYRIVNNTGKNAFQTIHNLYLHVIGGQQLQWPPYTVPQQDEEMKGQE